MLTTLCINVAVDTAR